MIRYLITGGAGFIGSSITKKLLKEGYFVRVLDDESRGSTSSLPKSNNLDFIKGDIRNFEVVNKACKNIHGIIHLAYINGTRYFYEKPDIVLDVGVKGMIHVLDAAKKNKVKELFLASSSEVYQTASIIPTPENISYYIPDSFNPRYSYAGGKIVSELLSYHIGRTFLKRVVIFRPHNVYGENMGGEHVISELVKKIIKLKKKSNNITLPIQGDGKSTRSFIHVDDFVNAVLILIKKGKNGEVYNIGTEEEVSIKNLISHLAKISKTTIQIQSGITPKGSVQRRCPSIKKISRLGFKPTLSLHEGVKKTYDWYNTQFEQL